MSAIIKRGSSYRARVKTRTGERSKTFKTAKEARAWAARVEAGLEEPQPRKLSLRTALERYEGEITPTKKGARQERNRIRAWIKDPITNRPMSDLTTYDLSAWRNRRLRSVSGSTVRNALTVLSQVYAVAASEWGCVGLVNPVTALRRPKPGPARDRRLEEGEEQRLLQAARNNHPAMAPLITFLLETAMRRSEALKITRADIKGGCAHLRDTKSGKPRVVPLSTRALEAVEELPVQLHGPLFGLRDRQVDWRWQKLIKAAGLPDLHLHDLRHEAVSCSSAGWG